MLDGAEDSAGRRSYFTPRTVVSLPGTFRTSRAWRTMSAIEGKADFPVARLTSQFAPKRTCGTRYGIQPCLGRPEAGRNRGGQAVTPLSGYLARTVAFHPLCSRRTAGKPRVGKPEMGISIFSLRGMISTAPKRFCSVADSSFFLPSRCRDHPAIPSYLGWDEPPPCSQDLHLHKTGTVPGWRIARK
jgi:hypothetical protein